ncbi:transmembrane protein [Thalictrum thalictroides]|uniref:Transmembrane protein n=1 Tax=Thalictrum thalictroides TaxID=46969 RepID=A0A7J6WE00_THATH|nr:transmembrane protein [Thalictrum thalictroides]
MGCSRLFIQLSFLIVFVLFFLSIGEIRAYTHGKGRTLLQSNNNASNSGKDLADTIRIDPLDNFNKYKGGFDITNKHYWSSTAFTGIYGYAIGAFWLLCGVLFGGYLLATTFCCSNRKKRKLQKRVPCSRQCYLWPIIVGVSFTFLAIIISGVVIGGTTRFHSRAKTVMDIIIDTADGASNTIYNVTDAMRGIRDNIALSNEGDRTSNFLNNTSQRLDKDAAELSRQAKKNRRLIDKGLKIVYITTVTIVSINMVAVIALSVCGFLRFRKAFYMLLILCWFIAALCWVSFGLYFFVEKFTGDTCTALGDFQQDPHNNSLSSIVPCDELISAESVLLDTRVGLFNLINEVNQNISTMQLPASLGRNQVSICNPFSAAPEYNYQPDNCPPNTIRIGDIPQILKMFTCSGERATCGQRQFLSNDSMRTVEAYTSSIQNLLNAFPGMESLVDCQVVKDAFTKILLKHCKPLKKFVKMVWASMVALSTIMVVLVLTWAVKAFHEKSHHFSDGSVKPHQMEVDEKIGADDDQTNRKLDP